MDNGHFFIDDTGTHQLTALGPPKGAPLVGPWARLLAEAALEQLEFSVAEKAFVRFEDYQGIQLVKRLRLLDDRVKQKAEVAAYFQRFDEAESLYREIDRKDLAIDLRVRLGDWFRVIQLAHGANEDLLHQAWSAIGDYYADRCKWHNAANYYAKAGNNAALVDTYYFLEDYDAMERVIPSLPKARYGSFCSPLLTEVGNKFASVGLCEQAVAAFLRHGDVKTAVDTCVLLNQWELAVNLAQQHNFQQIEGLLAKYAQHLLDKNKKIEAVQLYRKASRHTEAWLSLGRAFGLLESLNGFRGSLIQSQKAILSQLDSELEKVLLYLLGMHSKQSKIEHSGISDGDVAEIRLDFGVIKSVHASLHLIICLSLLWKLVSGVSYRMPRDVAEPKGEPATMETMEAFIRLPHYQAVWKRHRKEMGHMGSDQRGTAVEEDTSIASTSRKEKQEAAKDAEERFGASSAFANLNAEHAAKSVRRSAFDNFTQPEDVQHERCLVKVGKHPCFERVAMAATLLNAIWIPIDIEFNAEPASDASQGFFVVENIFLLFFSVELLLRFIGYSSGCNAIRDPPFIFDAVLVSMMVLETWLIPLVSLLSGGMNGGTDVARSASILRIARVMRVLRTARVAKLVRYMPELIILLKGMMIAFRSVFFTIVLLILVTVIFSVAITEVSRGTELPALLFSSMGSTLLTLLVQCIMPDQEESFKRAAADNWFVGLLWLLFILFASYIVMGLLVGVLVETVSTVATLEREQLDIDFAQKVLWEMIDKGGADEDGDNRISETEYVNLLSRPEAAKALTVLGVDMTAALDYGILLFEDGEPLTFAEFMEGMLTLRGSNHTTVKDIVDLRKFTSDEFSQLHEVLLDVCKFLASQGMQTGVVNAQKSRATRMSRAISRKYPK
ncbi:unnamed protein product [Cladocopium goreaui]|uniref:Sodium channel protein 1 brain n=1 Tax=Cladocopium goreaui TaxID=2562237 RepID=A0A9P1CDP9_9DINO|nr:unnamed protein product [Cladocopium goreaui]